MLTVLLQSLGSLFGSWTSQKSLPQLVFYPGKENNLGNKLLLTYRRYISIIVGFVTKSMHYTCFPNIAITQNQYFISSYKIHGHLCRLTLGFHWFFRRGAGHCGSVQSARPSIKTFNSAKELYQPQQYTQSESVGAQK